MFEDHTTDRCWLKFSKENMYTFELKNLSVSRWHIVKRRKKMHNNGRTNAKFLRILCYTGHEPTWVEEKIQIYAYTDMENITSTNKAWRNSLVLILALTLAQLVRACN